MKYWLTTHWPPAEDDDGYIPSRVYLQERTKEDGAAIRPSDLVFIYQSKTGPTIIRTDVSGERTKARAAIGRQGIVVLCEATTPLRLDEDAEAEEYVGRDAINWNWKAETKLVSCDGFVPRSDVNRVLGWLPSYPLKGIGSRKSGLLELREEQFNDLLDVFRENEQRPLPPAVRDFLQAAGRRPGGSGEGEDHRRLKEYVEANPSTALGEVGLVSRGLEWRFATGDRADIVLEDRFGRIIGVEIEVEQGPCQVEGFLQAIKYRHMLAPLHGRRFGETRSFLVAYSIADELKELCRRYEVEWFEIDRSVVSG